MRLSTLLSLVNFASGVDFATVCSGLYKRLSTRWYFSSLPFEGINTCKCNETKVGANTCDGRGGGAASVVPQGSEVIQFRCVNTLGDDGTCCRGTDILVFYQHSYIAVFRCVGVRKPRQGCGGAEGTDRLGGGGGGQCRISGVFRAGIIDIQACR